MRTGLAATQEIEHRIREVAPGSSPPEIRTTLLALVEAVSEVTRDEEEVVATVVHMLRSGSVRLCGSFRGVPVDRFWPPTGDGDPTPS